MKRAILFVIAILLLLNGYPQRFLNPHSYWTNRIKLLQNEVAEERESLAALTKELQYIEANNATPKAATGVRFSQDEVKSFRADNLVQQKRILKKIQARTEALRDAQIHYQESLKG